MRTLAILAFMGVFTLSNSLNIDLSSPKAQQNWRIINDGVMGGLSKGKVEKEKDYLLYTGSISFENNGGFSSYRSAYNAYELSNYKSIEIEYASEGGDFMFTLETAYRFYEPYYAIKLYDSNGKWKKVKVNLDEFTQQILGRPTGSFFSKADLENVIRIGFLKNDKREGRFKMKIKNISFS